MEISSLLPYVFIRFVKKDINSRLLFLMPIFYGIFSAVRLAPDVFELRSYITLNEDSDG